ncbi:hypothetical protein [Acidisoma sp. 7E03]
MSRILTELLRLGLGVAINPARLMEGPVQAARRFTVLTVCGIAAGFILLPAIGCAAAGLWIFVQHRLGPVWAAFITAAALALVAIIVLLIGLVAARPSRPRRSRHRNASEPQAAGPSLMETAAAMLPALVGLLALPKKAANAGAAAGRGFFARHKGTILIAAAVAGLVAGQDLFKPRRTKNPDARK